MSARNTIDPKGLEARLDRSLRNQVRAPRLDRRFDAAVWARIEAADAGVSLARESPASSRALRASRWLAIFNTLGIVITLGVASYFALGSFGGFEPQPLDVSLDVTLPALADDIVQRVITVLGQVLGLAALVFGLSFTSLGRRLRTSFS